MPAAEEFVRRKGYTPHSDTSWQRSQDLNVIVGTKSESATDYAQMAFFFYNGRFLGSDTSDSSASISKAWQDSTTVALSYKLYKASDANCCPSAGSATVRYRWNGSQLSPLDPIPTFDDGNNKGRR